MFCRRHTTAISECEKRKAGGNEFDRNGRRPTHLRRGEDVSPERSELRSRLNAGCAEVIPGLLESIRKATSERREYGKGKKVARESGAKAMV